MTRLFDADALSRYALEALLANECLAVRVSSFLEPHEVHGILHGINEVGMELYVGDTKGGSVERKGKIGPNLFRFKDELPEYFERVRTFDRETKPILFNGTNVPDRLVTALKNALPDGAEVHRAESASAGGKLSECTVRSLPAAPPHTDWIKAEMPDFDAFGQLIDQFAWNVYISTGQSGGETIIYDATDRAIAGQGAEPDIKIQPRPGDLILFRSRNVHAVLPTQGDRFTVSGFWGPRADGHVQYWV